MSSIDLNSIPGAPWLYHNLWVAIQALQDRIGEMTAPIFILLVAAILILERFFPANPKQKLFSVGLCHDVVWFLIQAVGEATILTAYAALLKGIYDRHLDWLTIEPMAALPAWLGLFLGLVFMDFLRWLQHLIQHKVPWFWQFHVVHHSQRHLNLFTDFRYHVFEYLVRQSVYFIPLMMFGVQLPEMVWLSLFLLWHARFYHSNIRFNLGFLRFIIVTPQSHRIHHSIEVRHQDRNLGAFLSIWDWIFGTQYPGHREFPETGVRDMQFPLEHSVTGLRLILTPIEQMYYPFLSIARSLFKPESHSETKR